MRRRYFKIKEVATLFGVTPMTLRNWNKTGKFIASRNPINNYRMYNRIDIENILAQIDFTNQQINTIVNTNIKPKIKKIKIKFLPNDFKISS